MGLIRGVTVTLIVKSQTGYDAFNAPVYATTEVAVDNVLIEPAANDAITSEYQINGKHLAYILHIPKADTNIWTDTLVKLPAPYNVTVKTYGDALVYMPELTPLTWNKKVKAEIYG